MMASSASLTMQYASVSKIHEEYAYLLMPKYEVSKTYHVANDGQTSKCLEDTGKQEIISFQK